jgi:hypothetical protein
MVVKIETETCEKVSGKTTKEQRYYISSLLPDAKVLNNNIRKPHELLTRQIPNYTWDIG